MLIKEASVRTRSIKLTKIIWQNEEMPMWMIYSIDSPIIEIKMYKLQVDCTVEYLL